MGLDDRDVEYLELAMSLAEKGRGCTSPNPMVGAVIATADGVVGQGYHAGPWHDHAEVAAIKDALGLLTGEEGDQALDELPHLRGRFAGATMYVTLEPCCTYGRTPPCTAAVIAGGFARVVVGVIDPSPKVNGNGLEQLRAAGVQVDLAEGDLSWRLKRQNEGLRKWIATGLPFVTYKYAMTLDGRVATDAGHSRWISSKESRELVHQMRSWVDAVMVGAGTLGTDDPVLTARGVVCDRQPLRVVLTADLTLDSGAALVRSAHEGPVLAVCSTDAVAGRRTEVESWGIETAAAPRSEDGALDPGAVAGLLGERGIQTVLLEGGPRVAGAWWAAGLIDRVVAFVCPRIAPGRENRAPLLTAGPAFMEEATRLRELETRSIGPDLLVSGYLREPF